MEVARPASVEVDPAVGDISSAPDASSSDRAPIAQTGQARLGLIRAAFDALDQAGVAYSFRKGSWPAESLPSDGEVDIALPRAERARADSILRVAGFHYLKSAGSPGHRFYVAFAQDSWLKIDAKIAGGGFRQALRDWWAGVTTRGLFRALALRQPLAIRRVGPVIALLGPDGAGKGTIIECLRQRIPVGLTTVYLGWRPRAARPSVATQARRVGSLREAAYVVYWAARYWRMLLPGYVAAWSGHIVLCDRHPIENLAVRPRATRLAARLEGILFGRLMPRPDAILLLDAAGSTLASRKGEDSAVAMERRRRAYREVFAGKGATVISTEQPVEATAAQAMAAVWQALTQRRRW